MIVVLEGGPAHGKWTDTLETKSCLGVVVPALGPSGIVYHVYRPTNTFDVHGVEIYRIQLGVGH